VGGGNSREEKIPVGWIQTWAGSCGPTEQTPAGSEVQLLGRGGGRSRWQRRLRSLAAEAAARNGAIAKRSAEAIRRFRAVVRPYPYKSLALTQMPGPASQGWPTLV